MAKYALNYSGLRKRETYDEIIDYIRNKQDVIRYPDRFAKRIREHPYLTQLDGEGLEEMQEQQGEAMKEQEKEHRVRQLASSSTQTAHEIRATARRPAVRPNLRDVDMDMDMDDSMEETRKRLADMTLERERKQANIRRIVQNHMGEDPGSIPFAAAAAASSSSSAAAREPRSRSPLRQEGGSKVEPMQVDRKDVKLKAEAMDTQTEQKRALLEQLASSKRRNTTETKVAAQAPQSAKPRGKQRAKSADDVAISGVSMNKTTDMSFWEQQSANELRSQITMRTGKRGDWAVKSRAQLLELIQKMIAEGKW